jgi:hypothetical protein
VAALAALTLAYAAPGFSQTSPALESLGKHIEGLREDLKTSEALRALGKELEAIKAGQQALHKDMQELKALLQARPAAAAAPAGPPSVVLSVAGAPFTGDKTAKLTLIECTDFQ